METTEARSKTLIESLIATNIAWMRANRITHEDYRLATDTLIASIRHGEESLLLDVFLEAEATDIGNIGINGSPEAVEGPFYLPGAPLLATSHMPQRPDERGSPLILHGAIRDPSGAPVANAEVDVWQADAEGRYSNFHPGVPDWNLRGRVISDAAGRYSVTTILPPPYEIPKDGPTGRVLTRLGRHFFRPAHVHVKLRHPDFVGLTSQLYFDDDPYLDSDVANAVRDDFVLKLRRRDAEGGVRYEAIYEFVLDAGNRVSA